MHLDLPSAVFGPAALQHTACPLQGTSRGSNGGSETAGGRGRDGGDAALRTGDCNTQCLHCSEQQSPRDCFVSWLRCGVFLLLIACGFGAHLKALHPPTWQEPSSADFGVLRYGQQMSRDIVLRNLGAVRRLAHVALPSCLQSYDTASACQKTPCFTFPSSCSVFSHAVATQCRSHKPLISTHR